MEKELEHVFMTYSGHEAINEQSSLRELLTCLRNLAEELQLDFKEALTESDNAYHGGSRDSVQGKVRVSKALDRLIELYTTTNKPDEVKEWQADWPKYRDIAPPPRDVIK